MTDLVNVLRMKQANSCVPNVTFDVSLFILNVAVALRKICPQSDYIEDKAGRPSCYLKTLFLLVLKTRYLKRAT